MSTAFAPVPSALLMIHTSPEPDVVPAEVTNGEPDPKPRVVCDDPTCCSPGTPAGELVIENARNGPYIAG